MPDFTLEDSHDGPVYGLDEVGRGPIAGPVIAACVFIPASARGHAIWHIVDDSKRLSASRREQVNSLIRDLCIYGLGIASVQEIDTMNILRASLLAMQRAYENMIHSIPAAIDTSQQLALVDGNRAPTLPCTTRTVIKGDQKSFSIAAASIVAKVERDELMTRLAHDYPMYDWSKNAGYPSPAHKSALLKYGPCPHHRTSFAPVRALLAA
jgi:ribonuclease HII